MKPKINDSKCGNMSNCKLIGMCPAGAISYINSMLVFDDDKCIECGLCAKECCVKAIEMI